MGDDGWRGTIGSGTRGSGGCFDFAGAGLLVLIAVLAIIFG